MESTTKLPTKHFYIIVIACAAIIFCESLQVLMRAKDPSQYALWVETIGEGFSFENYITMHLSYFTMKMMLPMVMGIYAYVTWFKVRIGKLFVFIWTVLLIGGLLNTLIEWDFYSGFYYIKMLGYILSIGAILSLLKVMRESSNEIRGE